MKPSQPVNYERAAANVDAAALMPTDPDVIERQRIDAEAHVADVRRRVAEESNRHRYLVQHFLICPTESA
jgi:hypothetical protein